MMLSVSELARLSGISGTIAYRLVQERQLPSCRIGRCVRFKKEDVGCYLEFCRS
jgi:excisionase family DNA binding protein